MHQRRIYGGSGGRRTGGLPVKLQEAVEDEAGAHGDADERHRPVAVQARQEHVGEQLAPADGADARDVKGRVDERGAVEHRHRPHRRRREACTSTGAVFVTSSRGQLHSQLHRGLHSSQSGLVTWDHLEHMQQPTAEIRLRESKRFKPLGNKPRERSSQRAAAPGPGPEQFQAFFRGGAGGCSGRACGYTSAQRH